MKTWSSTEKLSGMRILRWNWKVWLKGMAILVKDWVNSLKCMDMNSLGYKWWPESYLSCDMFGSNKWNLGWNKRVKLESECKAGLEPMNIVGMAWKGLFQNRIRSHIHSWAEEVKPRMGGLGWDATERLDYITGTNGLGWREWGLVGLRIKFGKWSQE